ncbi:MAG: STAS domain-containing protein [Planctomycetota bacterium]|jgi:anti-anti-sigma factor
MEFYSDEIDGDVMILAADGGLNRQTAENFIESIEALVDAGLTKLIIDCANLDFVSSYGLGLLVRLHRRLKQHGGNVKICNLRGLLPQVLEATKLAGLFEIYPDVNRARLAFRPRDGAGASEPPSRT